MKGSDKPQSDSLIDAFRNIFRGARADISHPPSTQVPYVRLGNISRSALQQIYPASIIPNNTAPAALPPPAKRARLDPHPQPNINSTSNAYQQQQRHHQIPTDNNAQPPPVVAALHPYQLQYPVPAYQPPPPQPALPRHPPAPPPPPRPARACPPLRLKLEQWGLPEPVVYVFQSKGVKTLFPWQAAALECGEYGNNLVYCAPTSGGKSMVAEILLIKRLMHGMRWMNFNGQMKPVYGRALFILPYVSVVSEKTEDLERILQPMGATVRGYYGREENGQPLAVRGETVAVCTMEKANGAINRLAAEGRLGELVCIVCDELHMVGDSNRGVGLEMSLSKVLASRHAKDIQLVAMSATMGGLESLQNWLRAALFITNFRPVPLTERAVFEGSVYIKKPNAHPRVKTLSQLDETLPPLDEGDEQCPLEYERELLCVDKRRDPDRLVPLVAEVVKDGHSALVFCGSRKACETCASLLVELLPKAIEKLGRENAGGGNGGGAGGGDNNNNNGGGGLGGREAQQREQRQQLVDDMKLSLGGPLSAGLEVAILAGVAWHHAGLTVEERNGIENGYRAGFISVLTATSTLAAGINLPARRVILRSLQQGCEPVERAQYLQMVGRAGRMGQSAIGESFIIGKGKTGTTGREWGAICDLIVEPVPYIKSQLLPGDADDVEDLEEGFTEEHTLCLQRLLLEGIACGAVRQSKDVRDLLISTFAAHQRPPHIVGAAAKAALKILSRKKQLIVLKAHEYDDEKPYTWEPTHKGKAVYDSGLPLEMAQDLYDSLRDAGMGTALESPLHLVYACLLAGSHPFTIHGWSSWLQMLERLPRQERALAALLGITTDMIRRIMGGRKADPELASRHARFAAALAITDLLGDLTPIQAEAKWGKPDFVSRAGLSRGQLQKLLTDVSKTFAMAALLCDSADWWPLATMYSNLSQTAAAGVRHELLPLMEVSGMCPAKARALYKAGIRDPTMLAMADQDFLAQALAAGMAQHLKNPMQELKRGGAGDKKQDERGAGGGGARPLSGGRKFTNKYAAVAVAHRAAKTLQEAARTHLAAKFKAADQIDENNQVAAAGSGPELNLVLENIAEQQQEEDGGGGGNNSLLDDDMELELNELGFPVAMTRQGRKIQRDSSDDAEQADQNEAGPQELNQAAGGATFSISNAAVVAWSMGQTKIVELRVSASEEELEQFLADWKSQPVWSIATVDFNLPLTVAMNEKDVVDGRGFQQRKVIITPGLVVCWSSQHVYFLDLAPHQLARHVGENNNTLRSLIQKQLTSTNARKICYNIGDATSNLAAAGLHLAGGHVDDPQVAGWLLNPETPAKYTIDALKMQLAPSVKLWTQRASRSAIHTAAKVALMTLVVADPARKFLANQGMLEAYLYVEMPAALVAGRLNAQSVVSSLIHISPRGCGGGVNGGGKSVDAVVFKPKHVKAVISTLEAAKTIPLTYLDRQFNSNDLATSLDNEARAAATSLSFDFNSPLLNLIQALKLPLPPPQRKRGRIIADLDYLIRLLSTLRVSGTAPHRRILSWLVQWKAFTERASFPLHKLLYPPEPAPDLPPDLQQELVEEGGPLLPLKLSTTLPIQCSTGTTGIGYGTAQDEALDSLLQPVLMPSDVWVSSLSLHAELMAGSVATNAESLVGWPVAAWTTPQESGLEVLGRRGGGEYSPQHQQQQHQNNSVLVAGLIVGVHSKKLRTMLDFDAVNNNNAAVVNAHNNAGEGAARGPLMFVIRLPPSHSTGVGVEVVRSADTLWRLRHASAMLHRPLAATTTATASSKPNTTNANADSSNSLLNESLVPVDGDKSVISTGLDIVCFNAGGGLVAAPSADTTLLTVTLISPELIALAQLTGDADLRAACCAPDPLGSVSACWGLAEWRVVGSGGVLICSQSVGAVLKALANNWSAAKLGAALEGAGSMIKKEPAAVLSSFMRAFPGLGRWWEAVGVEALRDGVVKTVTGRRQRIIDTSKGDAKLRGKLYKAAAAFAIGGTAADVQKAALAAIDGALSRVKTKSTTATTAVSQKCALCLVHRGSYTACVPTELVQNAAQEVVKALGRLQLGSKEVIQAVAVKITSGRSMHPLDISAIMRETETEYIYTHTETICYYR